jgi:signal transduction histidine kinase
MEGFDDTLLTAYRLETAAKTLRTGRLFALIVTLTLTWVAIVQDWLVLGQSALWPMRVFGIAGPALFLLSAVTFLKRRPGWIVPFHVAQLAVVMLHISGFSLYMYVVRPDLPGLEVGTEGALFVVILGCFVFASGARPFLPFVLVPPYACLVALLLINDAMRPGEWTLLVDPAIAILGVTVVAWLQENVTLTEFRARMLAERRKDELESRIEEIRTANERLEREIVERKALERRLDDQAQELAASNELLRTEGTHHRGTMRLLEQRAQELKRSNDDLQRFAYVASHDLKEPLRMIASFVELIRRKLAARSGLDREMDEFVTFAVDGVRRMEQLLDGLLSYSRVGTESAPMGRIELDSVLDAVRQNLRVAIEEAGARVKVGRLPAVIGDEGQLIQLFQNLLLNSLRYRDRERQLEVDVTAEESDGHARVSVRDNGIGIEPKYHERIFGMFQRLHTQAEYPGTGIGLALCRRIAERHGGRIVVRSELGEGATFTVVLPLKPPPATQ